MKHLRVLIIAIALMCITPSVFADVSVFIDENELEFSEQAPIIIQDRVFVPMRSIFEELGAYVDWVGETNTVFASKRFRSISVEIGARQYYVDGIMKTLDVPATILNSRAMVPIRVVAEGLGAEVVWDNDNRRVIIYNEHGDYIIEDRYIDYWECAEDGSVILTGRTAYPEIQAEDEISLAFNDFFLGDAEEMVDSKRLKLYDAAMLNYEAANEGHTPYMAERNFDITYNSNNILSILFADSDYLGGFHPTFEMLAVTYDMKTGKKLDCTDVIDATTSEIRKNVKAKFLELINENPEQYYSDAEACLDNVLAELKWYLKEDGVHFFLNPYEIAPYAAGIIEVIY